MGSGLSHFDDQGASRMVDVGDKAVSERVAVARSEVQLRAATLRKILDREFAKGDVIEVARLAGIMGAKRTADLIPLCHPLMLTSVRVDVRPQPPDKLFIEATVKTRGQTGVEMEALTAASIAALTIYDMCKAIDREIRIGPTWLQEKSGGKSGHFVRAERPTTRRDETSRDETSRDETSQDDTSRDEAAS